MLKVFFLSLVGILLGVCAGLYIKSNQPVLTSYIMSPQSVVTRLIEYKKPQVLGFLPYWQFNKAASSYRDHLTSLAYFSLTISGDGSIKKFNNQQEEEPGWTTLKKTAVKEYFKKATSEGLKTSLVIFGSTKDSIGPLLTDPIAHANNLLTDIAPIVKEYNFGDLNLDIEVVGEASLSAQTQFTSFVREVKKGLVTQNLGSLSVDATVMTLFQTDLINPRDVSAIADTFMIMTYDFHVPSSTLAGPIAPLGGAETERVYDVPKALRAALAVVPAHKLLLGIPLYGYEWETISDLPGSPAIPYSGQTASDQRVATLLSECTNCIRGYDEIAQEPFILFSEGGGFHQIYYTDNTAIKKRLQLSHTQGIAGVGLWAIGYENPADLPLLQSYKKGTLVN